jgi:hypothetical protein
MQIDYARLERRCLASIDDYHVEGNVTNTEDGIYIFNNHDSPVLAIAHLDSVEQESHFRVMPSEAGTRIENAQLDDRLGAYIILDLLPQLGITSDILLTEGEEVYRSTAKYFTAGRQYNWMFSFDRGGTDVVMYQYDDSEMRRLLASEGFVAGEGTGSDIRYLEHLGCKGFNFGCGYHDRHHNAYAIAEQTVQMVDTFTRFYKRYRDQFLPHPGAVE